MGDHGNLYHPYYDGKGQKKGKGVGGPFLQLKGLGGKDEGKGKEKGKGIHDAPGEEKGKGKGKSKDWLTGYLVGFREGIESVNGKGPDTNPKVPCPICGKWKKIHGMAQHAWEVHGEEIAEI